jgi:hypothetical protein
LAQGKAIGMARLIGALATSVLLVLMVTGTAPALANTPAWSVRSFAVPNSLTPGGSGQIIVIVSNLGDTNANASISPIEISDALPHGVAATSIRPERSQGVTLSCSTTGVVGCEVSSGELEPYGVLQFYINVAVANDVASPSTAMNEVSVSGGGAPSASGSEGISINSAPIGFGVAQLEQFALEENGLPDTQAGSHPFGYTTVVQLNESTLGASTLPKDLHFDLPAGVIANPTVVAQCTTEQFSTPFDGDRQFNLCPEDTAVGVATVWLATVGHLDPVTIPIFNMVPSIGEPARFAFEILGIPIFLDTSVRAGGDYGVDVNVSNINTTDAFAAAQVTIWGAPADPRHDQSRGWSCLYPAGSGLLGRCPASPAGGLIVPPFLTLPTSCTGPLHSTVEADSWKDPGVFASAEYTWHDDAGPLEVDGCNRLPFDPSLEVVPNGRAASTPTGLAVVEHVPQESTLNPAGLAESDVKNTTVALPTGVQLSPSAGDGLLACSEEEVGFKGFNPQAGLYEFTPNEPSCPEASKVGTVRVKTPLLPHQLTGAVYLAAQNANPFGSLVALYLVAHDPYSGVLAKAVGEVVLNPVTGQVTATFPDDPQVPYEELEVEFFGTARAPLTTPASCGEYTSQSSIEPWSGNAPASPSSTFAIDSGPGGGPCASPQPFAPGFESGTSNLQAGAFTPFELTMSRPDADQTLGKVETQLPPGLLGALSSVKLCEEPQAAAGTCGEESLIGHTTVSAGLGGDPYTVSGGRVYITGPYGGAPFGLSIVEPAVAGPFNLGTIVVRAQIRVDPVDSHLTVVTDALPTIIDGIPIQIQHVNVSIDRPGFVFNPTNCEPLKITGTLSSTEAASAGVSSPFQVTNCGSLAFKPGFAVSTSAKTSRVDGASLHVSLTLPAQAGKGTESNVAKVRVSLPKQLPSPLKTLQKACLEKVFEANPRECPVASQVGQAKVSTPLLSGPLTGTAYFVSHGGAKYPELIMVLVGEDGVTVDVHGETFISKQGITSATFSTVPDVPFSSFELTLPEREYPALTANGNLCKGTLLMPTEFVGQDGTKITQSTKISVAGCPRAKQARKAKRHRQKKVSKRRRKRR